MSRKGPKYMYIIGQVSKYYLQLFLAGLSVV